MIFRTANDGAPEDIRYKWQYWTNRLIMLTRAMDQDDRVWEPAEDMDITHVDFRTQWTGFHEIARNLRGAGVNQNDVLDGIEAGSVPYNPFATDATVVDFDRERAPHQVLDFDQARVAFSAEQWDASVDWPEYEW